MRQWLIVETLQLFFELLGAWWRRLVVNFVLHNSSWMIRPVHSSWMIRPVQSSWMKIRPVQSSWMTAAQSSWMVRKSLFFSHWCGLSCRRRWTAPEIEDYIHDLVPARYTILGSFESPSLLGIQF